MFGALFFAVTAWAFYWAWTEDRKIWAYLGWHLARTLIVRPAALLFGVTSLTYTGVYLFLSIPLFIAIGRIAWDRLRCREYRLRPVAVALLFTLWVTKTAWIAHPNLFQCIAMTQGALLSFAGVLLAALGLYPRPKAVPLTLGAFWLTQALFNFGFALHFPQWVSRLNWWVQPAMGTVAFLVIGWRLRRQAIHSSAAAS